MTIRSLLLPSLVAAASAPAALASVVTLSPGQNIQAAVNAAQAGDEIELTPGVYEQVFTISDKPLTIRSTDPADPMVVAATVLDGVLLDSVITVTGAGASGTVVDGLTIRNGLATAQNDDNDGGGIHLVNAGSLVTIRRCVIEDCMVLGDDADNARGGAVASVGTNVHLLSCRFANNDAQGPGSDAGAVWLSTGTHLVEDCLFTGNHAVSSAGAARFDGTVSQVTGCHFEGNACDELGGAIWTVASNRLTIDASRFLANTAETGGAIRVQTTSTSLTVRNSVFQGNHAEVWGGAIYSEAALTASCCTFEGNSAGTGNAAISGSLAAIPSHALSNSIFWGNEPVAGQILTNGATTPTVRHCLIEGGLSGAAVSGVLDADPMFADAAGGDLHLLPGSPAVDRGDTTAYCGPLVDLDGATRGVDDPASEDLGLATIGPVIDIGAYERQVAGGGPPSCPADLDGDGLVDVQDLVMLVLAWGACP